MELTLQEKLHILSDAAKYDVACTSSGSERAAVKGKMGSTEASGICHAFAGDGRCISLLKILMTNECIYDCKYCVNRRSNDVPRTSFTPEEICTLTMEFYRRNYIEGLFLSSGILQSPTHTMELMYEAIYLLRYKYGFMGYIHVKGIPGADETLIEKLGFLVDRMSMNIEHATDEGLKKIAPNKNSGRIIQSIAHIRDGIQGDENYGLSAYQTTRLRFQKGVFSSDIHALWENAVPKEKLAENGRFRIQEEGDKNRLLTVRENEAAAWGTGSQNSKILPSASQEPRRSLPVSAHLEDRKWLAPGKLSKFTPAGQSTQMIIGASDETDYDIINKAEFFYTQYTMKRVFYSAFINTTHDPVLPETPDGPPLLREHRLYQADFLLRYYGFRASEIVDAKHPNLNPFVDPKCNWALNHIEFFPVEVQTASYAMLLRVPGIGAKSAERIVRARRNGLLTFESLKKMGVVMKRAHYFILCQGRQLYRTKMNDRFILGEMMSMDREKNWQIPRKENFRQLDMFADLGVV